MTPGWRPDLAQMASMSRAPGRVCRGDRELEAERIVGAGSVHTRDDAMTAGEMGADYVMFGEPHEGARARGLASLISLTERVVWWAQIFETPCVAYADTIDAVEALADAGADFVALGDAIWDRSSPTAALREAQALIASVGVQLPMTRIALAFALALGSAGVALAQTQTPGVPSPLATPPSPAAPAAAPPPLPPRADGVPADMAFGSVSAR